MTLIDADREFLEQEGTEETEMETPRSEFPGVSPPLKTHSPETGPGHWLHDGNAKTRTNTV